MVVNLSSVTDWLAYGALIVPLAALAWAAVRHVQNERKKIEQAEFDNFYRTLERVHNKDASLILQRAAVFELRNVPKYRDFIVRLCRDRNQLFPCGVEAIQAEILLTLQHFESSEK
jgi:hypothetical protein